MVGFSLSVVRHPLLVGLHKLLGLRLAAPLQQSINLRSGAGVDAGGVVELWLFSSLPAVIAAAAVHRATSRGRRRPHTVRAAVAADSAGGQGDWGIGRDDRCPGGVGQWGRGADFMVMLEQTRKSPVYDLIVALLGVR